MQLLVNPIIGSSFILNNVNGSDTISTIKNKIKNAKGIPVNKQILICRKKMMNDGNKLENYPNIKEDQGIVLRIIPTNNHPMSSPGPSGGKKGGTKKKGRKIYKGPRGGKYYMKGGNKVYL